MSISRREITAEIIDRIYSRPVSIKLFNLFANKFHFSDNRATGERLHIVFENIVYRRIKLLGLKILREISCKCSFDVWSNLQLEF